MFDSSNDTPERRLIGSIILQAITDAFTPHNSFTTPAERWQAILFLADEHGPWARSRRDLCDCLDVDPGLLRVWAIGVLEGAPFFANYLIRDPAAMPTPKHLKNDAKVDEARVMWREMEAKRVENNERASAKKNYEAHPRPKPIFKRQNKLPQHPTPNARNLPPMPDGNEALIEDECLFLVAKDGLILANATINGHNRPAAVSKFYRLLKALTTPNGASIADLESCTPDWRKLLPKFEDQFDVAVVWVDHNTAVLRRRPPEPGA